MLKEQYLLKVQLKKEKIVSFDDFPFRLPVVRFLNSLDFHPKVTFIVGENGSGKSTLLESLAIAYGFNPEGGSKNFTFSSKNSHSNLHEYIRITKGHQRPKDGYFLRAESFYNLATEIDNLDLSGSYGGNSLHEQSHGESFFSLINNRFHGNGLYILDEPEAALSPMRQIALLKKIHDLLEADSQFIIATHSPIILAYPRSFIYELSEDGIHKVPYQQTENFMISKQFLNNPSQFLNHLIS